MTDDIKERLRKGIVSESLHEDNETELFDVDAADELCEDALECIEKLEAVTKDDARWLAAYHHWCEMNGCAPSSSDLIAASKALEGKDG